MKEGDFDENGEPIPKNSAEIKENNIPKESIKNSIKPNQEENLENSNMNEEMKNNDEINNDNNFPNPSNDDFDNYLNSNENKAKKEDNEDFNNNNTFNDDNLNNNENNNNSFRVSNVNNDNNRISNINNNNEENNDFRASDINKENNGNIQNNRYSNTNNENQNNENENEFDYGDDNNFNYDNNNQNSNFGFRDSDLKDNNNNDENNNNIRNSANSDHMKINEENENDKENQQENNTNLRSKPNNSTNQNNNNSFNYAKNPYGSTINNNSNNNNNNNNINNINNNYNISNPNGGYGYMGTNMNQTTSHFIPQDNHQVINNLNSYGGGGNYYNNKINHHSSYDPYYEQFEELPEDSDGFHLDKNKRGKDSTLSAGVQIANTIMGAGILSIPIIMNYLGIICGSIFVIFTAISTLFSVYLLLKCHQITGKSGYSMFGKITMGKFGSILIKIIIIINNLGICICYFRIFGEVVQTIVQAWASENSFWVTNRNNYIYILIGSLIMFSFIFIKNISSLKKVAYLGVIAVLIFCFALTVLLFYKSASNKLDQDITWDYLIPECSFKEAFDSISTVFIAFLFQFNVFPIYYSMRNRGMDNMMKATKIGVIYSLIIFLIVGIIGFLIYGDAIEDTILDNMSDDMLSNNSNFLITLLIIIISFSFIITCLSSFPILFLSLRVNYVNSLIVCMKSCRKNQVEQVEISQGKFQKKKQTMISEKVLIVITICLYAFIVAFAILVYYLKTMFIIVGATAGIFIGFILPNLFYIIIVNRSKKNYSLILNYIYVGIGVFLFILEIFLAFC